MRNLKQTFSHLRGKELQAQTTGDEKVACYSQVQEVVRFIVCLITSSAFQLLLTYLHLHSLSEAEF